MTVRSIVEMFENLAVSAAADQSAHGPESPGRGNVNGLVTYYDGLAVVEEPRIIVPTKTVVFPSAKAPATSDLVEDSSEEEDESNQDASEEVAAEECGSAPQVDRISLPVSKIPQPKSREFHLCSVRKESMTDSKSVRAFSSTASTTSKAPSLYIPPPTPVSSRMRSPCTSYAAFVARIENSQSRLLDFEKDERWIGQVETMKGRVEALKRRSQASFLREVASTPRKCRSMSECSGISTASTASLSSTDTLEQM